MFSRLSRADAKKLAADDHALLGAISASQAIIEFMPDGTIIRANANFLSVMGYNLEDIAGKHHRIFLDPDYAGSAEYREFWLGLLAGGAKSAQLKRLG